jgi:hypothetical protein
LRQLSLKPDISQMSDSSALSRLEVVRIIQDKKFADKVANQVFKRRSSSSQRRPLPLMIKPTTVLICTEEQVGVHAVRAVRPALTRGLVVIRLADPTCAVEFVNI